MAYYKAEEQYTQCGKACKEFCYPEERKEQDNERKLRKYYTEKEAQKLWSKSMQRRTDIQKKSSK